MQLKSVYSLFSDYLIGIQQCLIKSKERLITGGKKVEYSFANAQSKLTTSFGNVLTLFKIENAW